MRGAKAQGDSEFDSKTLIGQLSTGEPIDNTSTLLASVWNQIAD